MPDTLNSFAAANDAAAATPAKLRKQSILADYFRALDEHNLPLAVRYCQGRAFAMTDDRLLNVGGAIVVPLAMEITALDPHEFRALVIRSGETGEALSKSWPIVPIISSPPLTLQSLSDIFDSIAATGIVRRKRELLRNALSRCRTGREAAYLIKIIFGDLRTGAREGVLQAAVAQAFDKITKQIQRCQLLVGDLGQVALLARRNALDSAAFTLFHPIQFMLAAPLETPEQAAGTLAGRIFLAEHKLDGIRAQIHKSDDRVAIYTRTMDRTDASFPDVVQAIRKIPGQFLLDGEIVPFHNGIVLPFSHIQKRLGRKAIPQRIIAENPAVFIAFDILYRDGDLLMDHPLRDRRIALKSLADATPASLLISDASEVGTTEQIAQAFAAARRQRNEGLMLKDPDSVYSPGRRGLVWFKIKTHLPTFDCVVTAAEYGHGKRRSTLSDYTFAVWDRDPAEPGATLVNIGKAYSGVTDDEIAALTTLFLELSLDDDGQVHQVEPRIVLEIACDQIQRSDRHASGFALRFPRIKRIRWDKRPQDADRLQRIDEIYRSTDNTSFSQPFPSSPDAAEPTLFDHLK